MDVKKVVKESYAKIAESGCSCGCGQSSREDIAKSIGYSDDEISSASSANLGLGCGNPIALANIRDGDTVLDLGSGAGFDCFLASKKAGPKGKVIGVDMTEQMVDAARENARKYGYSNVEFKLGDIEALPVDDNSVDIVISNCVINLAPDKKKVFNEAYRVLRKGGRLVVSDMVLLKELSPEQRRDEKLVAGCVGGALLKEDYLRLMREAGFKASVLSEDAKIGELQYNGLPVESLKAMAVK